MGRRVEQRSGDYSGDVPALLRIVKAVEQDPTVTSDWRSSTSEKLREVIQALLAPEKV